MAGALQDLSKRLQGSHQSEDMMEKEGLRTSRQELLAQRLAVVAQGFGSSVRSRSRQISVSQISF